MNAITSRFVAVRSLAAMAAMLAASCSDPAALRTRREPGTLAADLAGPGSEIGTPLQAIYVLPNGQHPENVTFDPDSRTFYVSHFTGLDGAGILAVAANGQLHTVIPGSELPYPATSGIRYDKERGLIWVCVDDIFAFRTANQQGSSAFLPRDSYLMAFEPSGTERRRIAFNSIPGIDRGTPKLCNDLAVDEDDGSVFATDSYSGNLIRVDGSTSEASVLLHDDRLRDTRPVALMAFGANGIALEKGWVYVTVTFSGILLRVRRNGTDVQEVTLSEPVFGDGLAFAHHVAFAVSAPAGRARELVQITVDQSEDSPSGAVTHLPWPNVVSLISPTAGTVVEGRYYIADAYFPAFSRPTVPGQFFAVDLPSADPVAAGVAAQDRPAWGPWSTPVNLGSPINSTASEQHPAISKDGLSLYFASNRSGGLGGLDIYVSQRASVDDAWEAPVNLGPNINSAGNDLAPTFSPDGHSLYFHSNGRGGCGGADLFVSRRQDKRDDLGWGVAEDLGCVVNTAFEDAGPTIFEDEATGITMLIFTSTRPGGPGDFDIYQSTRVGDGEFGPASLVAELSAPFRDTRTAISRDGLELFLSSDVTGRPNGVGSQDLWVSTRATTSDPWSAPANLGPGVNSTAFDGAPALSFDGTTLYFFSARPGGLGGNDLYVTTRARVHPVAE